MSLLLYVELTEDPNTTLFLFHKIMEINRDLKFARDDLQKVLIIILSFYWMPSTCQVLGICYLQSCEDEQDDFCNSPHFRVQKMEAQRGSATH